MNKIFVLLLIVIFSINSIAQQRINFDENWKFQLGEQEGAEEKLYNDNDWRGLNVPHDWSIEGDYAEDNSMGGQCGYLPAGIGWYRKTIEVPKAWKGKHVEISFDGVFMNSTVWANGRKLGTRPYGWISFNYDISKEVETSNSITFSLRIDNDKQPSARWYTGSGIYAHTWIEVKNPIQISKNGIFIKTKGNTVTINTELKNKEAKHKKVTLVTSILDAKGDIVSKTSNKVKLENKSNVEQTLTIESPLLWSVESPNLYTVFSEIKSGSNVLHSEKTRFGVRDIQWIPETGMWINGKNVKLQGVCNHQDAGALGAAVPDKILRFRILQLKKMGVNTIRTAHNPQTPIFYEICDEVGMMVMDEIFDGWKKKAANDYGAHHFDKWWKKDVTDWIVRDRNHPSIVIYSVGNETRGEIGEDLVKICHELDATRPVTSGHSSSEYMDVFGVNGESEKIGFFDDLEKDRVFIGTENTHTWQVRGFYRTKTWYRDGYPSKRQQPHFYPDLTEKEVFSYDWTNSKNKKNFKQIFNSSYDNGMVRLTSRHNIEQLRDIPNYAGSFRWTGYDYIGEATYVHGGWPFKSFMGGAIDMANFEKDLFYLYQSQWTKKPMIHILPHWTHPTLKLGTEIPVWVYSNCDEVELFLNNKSLGKKKPGKKWEVMQCQWLVGFQPGELKAIGYVDGEKISEEIIRTASTPSQIALTIDGEPLLNKNDDIVQVRVTTQDSKGEFYPYGENRTYFKVLGFGKIQALDNGSPIDIEKHFEAKNRIAFFGLTRAYVKSTSEDKPITLLATSILGEKKQVTSKTVSIDTKLLALRGSEIKAKVKIYYTTNGMEPTQKAKLYKIPFDVELGTTVKALVVVNGEASYIMEERFTADEGFVWDAVATAAVLGGDQAEDASFNEATFSNLGKGFNGKGFLNFGRNNGGYVEWYQENDGSEGVFDLNIRYSANNKIRPIYKVLLTINGKDEELDFPATKEFAKGWEVFNVKVPFVSGANTVRLTILDDDGFLVDELVVK